MDWCEGGGATGGNPGQGVYRSSYRNARRLAATETNMAYRSADYERWQQLDFVVGIEIKLSGNHTTHDGKGNIVPLTDICDELAGRYPKDFKFTGWHPNCRCHAETILKTEKEMKADTEKILRGEDLDSHSVNEVTATPENFNKWINNNEGRISMAKDTPYFMKDNPKYLEKASGAAKTAARGDANRGVAKSVKMIPSKVDLMQYSKAQQKMFQEFEIATGVKRGESMSIEMADKLHSNRKYKPHSEYSDNCSVTSITYVMREFGFDVTAKGSSFQKIKDLRDGKTFWYSVWKDSKGRNMTQGDISSVKDWAIAKKHRAMSKKL